MLGGLVLASVDDPFRRCRSDGRCSTESAGFRAAAILILFGLAALAPACYSAWVFGQKLSTHWPRLRPIGLDLDRWRLSRLCWRPRRVRVGSSRSSRDGRLCSHRPSGRWPAIGCGRGEDGPDAAGRQPAGVIAWGAGVAIALALEAGRRRTIPASAVWWRSTAISGSSLPLVVYWLLARLGRERPAVAVEPA